LPHEARAGGRQFTSIVALRKTTAAVNAAPRKKEVTGRSLLVSPLTFDVMFLLFLI
jgi:hypothetical protein